MLMASNRASAINAYKKQSSIVDGKVSAFKNFDSLQKEFNSTISEIKGGAGITKIDVKTRIVSVHRVPNAAWPNQEDIKSMIDDVEKLQNLRNDDITCQQVVSNNTIKLWNADAYTLRVEYTDIYKVPVFNWNLTVTDSFRPE